MRKLIAVFAVISIAVFSSVDLRADQQRSEFTLDEGVWVLFYDVPSRRFRRSRDAFVRRDWGAVGNDLAVAAGFIRAEASRSIDDLSMPLENVADRLDAISESIDSSEIKGSDLDAAFARAHWLLAQHYLELAQRARDDGDSRKAGSYLWATAHHMERTVLWSDARMSRAQVASLDQLRDLADRLRTSDSPADIFKKKPIVLAHKTLNDLGVFLDRKVWIESP